MIYLANNEVQQVREGYFVVDKNKQEIEVEGWDRTVSFNEVKLKANCWKM
jgi:hypothetical protein